MALPLKLSYFIIPSTILILYIIRRLRESTWGVCKNAIKLDNKIAVITGANTGMGFEVAKELAARNATVIMACRNIEKADEAIKNIKNEFKDKTLKLVSMELDLSSLKSIKRFSTEVKKRYQHIHYLVNNAGVSYPRGQIHVTEDNFEIHFGVNYLGHFYLTNLLLDTLKNSVPSRVIVISSTLSARGKVDLDHLNYLQAPIDQNLYSNSKLANIYFARELAKRTEDSGVSVHIVFPGWVKTELFRHSWTWYNYILVAPVAFFYMRSPRIGAQTAIFCITDPNVGKSGLIYRDCNIYDTNLRLNDEIGAKLWGKTEELITEKINE